MYPDFYGSNKGRRIIFVIILVLLDAGKNEVDKLIAHAVEDEHFVFAFGYFSLIVGFERGSESHGHQGGQMEPFFNLLVGLGTHTGLPLVLAGAAFERHHAGVGGEVFGVSPILKLIGGEQDFYGRNQAHARHGRDTLVAVGQRGISGQQGLDGLFDGCHVLAQGPQGRGVALFFSLLLGGRKEALAAAQRGVQALEYAYQPATTGHEPVEFGQHGVWGLGSGVPGPQNERRRRRCAKHRRHQFCRGAGR